MRTATSFLSLLLSVDAAAQSVTLHRSSIASYRAAVEAVKTRAPRALEAALARFDAVRDALLGATDSGILLETLSLAEFDRLERELPAVLLGREESLVVQPDPEFFQGLSGRPGDGADRAFFAAYKENLP